MNIMNIVTSTEQHLENCSQLRLPSACTAPIVNYFVAIFETTCCTKIVVYCSGIELGIRNTKPRVWCFVYIDTNRRILSRNVNTKMSKQETNTKNWKIYMHSMIFSTIIIHSFSPFAHSY